MVAKRIFVVASKCHSCCLFVCHSPLAACLPLLCVSGQWHDEKERNTWFLCTRKQVHDTLVSCPHFAALWLHAVLHGSSPEIFLRFRQSRVDQMEILFRSVARNLVGICFSSVGVPSFWLRGRMFLLHQMLVNFVERWGSNQKLVAASLATDWSKCWGILVPFFTPHIVQEPHKSLCSTAAEIRIGAASILNDWERLCCLNSKFCYKT